jgi:gamma-glutamyl-gamma-aminobutyrate hydrolase PuuD
MTKKEITVLVNKSAGCESYVALLEDEYKVTEVDAVNWNGEKIDLILFTGGEDVNPSYYDESKGMYTGINNKRDDLESRYMALKREHYDVPKLGICRGAQFLTVIAGGKLIQHVSGHATGNNHLIDLKVPYAGNFEITSTHHQMMYPYKMDKNDYQIVATARNFLSHTYLNGMNNEIELDDEFEECEIVYYPKIKALAIQGHPEFHNCPTNTRKMCLDLIRNFLKL